MTAKENVAAQGIGIIVAAIVGIVLVAVFSYMDDNFTTIHQTQEQLLLVCGT